MHILPSLRTFLIALVVLSLPTSLLADTKRVWESPAASVSQTIGISELVVKYHRPAVKGREIWGKLVPYGQVWRAGANDATTISFSTAVKVAGRAVPAGTYALFVQPARDKWTFILSKDAEQWGAYFYKPEHDQLRFDVTPAAAPAREWLTYELEPEGTRTVVASLHWDKLGASFPIEVDVDGLYHAYLAAEVARADASTDKKQRWEVYFIAAKYWIARDEKLDEAARLLDKADQQMASFYGYEWRGRLYAKQGRVKEALALVDKAKAAATGKAPKEYVQGLDALAAEWTAKKK